MNLIPSLKKLITLFFLLLLLSACNQNPHYPKSDHYDGKHFFNEDRATTAARGLIDVLKWKLFDKATNWPEMVNDNVQPNFPTQFMPGEVAITHINHSTEVIQLNHTTIITDPIFSKRASPLSWLGPKRHRKPGVELASLPKLDVVVISHNHYDHLDKHSLSDIEKRDHPVFIVPLGNKNLLESIGIQKIVELDWWHELTLNGNKITLVPMQHWSARSLTDRCESLWGGYVIETANLKVLFSGDTGYNTHFKEIEKKLGPIDVSILPIGVYLPRWFMKAPHMNPKDAVQAHLDLKSQLSIGNHFGTFQLSDEGIEDPVVELQKNLEVFKVNPQRFIAPKNGQTVRYYKF